MHDRLKEDFVIGKPFRLDQLIAHQHSMANAYVAVKLPVQISSIHRNHDTKYCTNHIKSKRCNWPAVIGTLAARAVSQWPMMQLQASDPLTDVPDMASAATQRRQLKAGFVSSSERRQKFLRQRQLASCRKRRHRTPCTRRITR
jgi:hypothetical protein